jgi:hypothetical protein
MKIPKNAIKNTIIISCGIILLSGCATYKFHKGQPPHDKGYVVSRDDYAILEYSVGKDNSVPDIELAKKRFNKRRKIVEDYYKRIGYIQNHFKMAVWDPCIMFIKVIGGVFKLPSIAISDYKYAHNPKYRERILQLEAEEELREANRIKKLKEELNTYIQQDLSKESPPG